MNVSIEVPLRGPVLKVVPLLGLRKDDPYHDERGRFASGPGSGKTEMVLQQVKSRVFNGESVPLNNTPSKLEVGKLGEQIVTQYLKDQGFTDARSLNVNVNNFPVDLVQDHQAIEVKAGLVSNGKSAQQWRATIGQPGPKEAKWLARASDRAKAAWNEKKQQAILDRKQAVLKQLSKDLGRTVKGSTMTVILNPDKKTADLYRFSGFHLRIAWNSDQAKSGYVGTFKYGK
jgi:hypothetical protein